MLKNALLLCTLVIFSRSISAATETADCVILTSGATLKLELRTSNDFFNCFLMEGLEHGKPITIYSIMPEHPPHRLSVYEFYPPATKQVAQLDSDKIGAAVYKSSVSSDSMGFRVVPAKDLEHNINLTVSYIQSLSAEVIVFVELYPIG